MRALNPRRPQLTSTYYLFPRFLLYLLLALFVVHGGQARSVQSDEEGLVQPEGKLSAVGNQGEVELTLVKAEDNSAPEQVQEKLLVSQSDGVENEKVKPEEPGNFETKVSQPEVGVQLQEGARSNPEPLTERQLLEISAFLGEIGKKEVTKKEDVLETPVAGDPKVGVSAERDEALNQEDEEASVAKKRRRNDLADASRSQVQDAEGAPVEQVEKVKDEGIRRFDVQVDAEDAVSSQENVAAAEVSNSDGLKRLIDLQNVKTEESTPVAYEQEDSAKADEENVTQYFADAKEEIPSYFRKSAPLEGDELGKDEEFGWDEGSGTDEGELEYSKNREYRYAFDTPGKSRRKSSTVYLNAEEKKVPVGEQQSIVDGQIKKLISIRNDALVAQKSDKLEEGKLLSFKREVGMDEVAFTQESDQSEQGTKVKDTKFFSSRQLLKSDSILKIWRAQAANLQQQIRNRIFLLPEMPKFTENQLLAALNQIVLSKRLENLDVSYVSNVENLGLTEKQLQIIKCAEQLIAVRERQSFVANFAECIRGLSALNCIKIFVWPVLVDNLPTSITQNFDNLPIEINVFDLFQGNKPKTGRSQNFHHVIHLNSDIIVPKSNVFDILLDALESSPKDETLVSFIDPNNATLKALLNGKQITRLQLAEKFLPQAVYLEYADSMSSCIRKFEYYNCLKYIAWPLLKRYFPSLPAFPSHPIYVFTPDHPFGYYPNRADHDLSELQKVVDADATRTKEPKIEASIIMVLQNTLKEQAWIPTSPSSLDHSADAYLSLIPQDQLLSINMAEQLIPVPLRPEFVQKTVNCMKEFNYLTCIKYSTWPTVKQFVPSLPDISALLPDFQLPGFPNIADYIPNFPNLGDLGNYWSLGASAPNPSNRVLAPPTYFLLRERPDFFQSSDILETKMLDVLINVRNSLGQCQEISLNTGAQNMITFPTLSNRQNYILLLVQCLLPYGARSQFIADTTGCFFVNDNYIDCSRIVIWPTMAKYVPEFPNFPTLGEQSERIPYVAEISSVEKIQERINSDADKDSDKASSSSLQDKGSAKKVQQSVPVISVTDTRFAPIYTEHPDTVIFNILRSVQLQSLNLNRASLNPQPKSQALLDYLNQQQTSIAALVDSLLPTSVRTEYINKMIQCLRQNNFYTCTRDITWPTLMQYIPWLPNFPDFGSIFNPSNNSTSSPSSGNITDPSPNSSSPPLSETNVRTGLHGDTTVTITDTKFFPIYDNLPETVILNMLKAVQFSVPDVPGPLALTKTEELPKFLSQQQCDIIRTAESLLPNPNRPNFINKTVSCLKDVHFWQCAKDIIWPAVAESYPWLPNFPNFASLQEKVTTSNLEGQKGSLNPAASLPDSGANVMVMMSDLPLQPIFSIISQYSEPKSLDPSLPSQPDNQAASSTTPSVGSEGADSSAAGQVTSVSKQGVQSPENIQRQANAADLKSLSQANSRKRRSTDLSDTYYETDEGFNSSASSETFPNITESRYLQLLIKIKQTARTVSDTSQKQYYVDTLNSTMRDSLTADQYEILKLVQDLDRDPSGKGLAQQVIQCITSLSFIRCMGIFVWPLITNNLPSLLGLPSLPSFPSLPGFGIFGRSIEMESKVQEYFGMSASDFENELLSRKESIEQSFLDWYKKLVEDEFQTNLGFLKIKGYGNGEVGINFSGFREGRGAKLKDNKNLPSILTIISDIMEEVLDQRPEGEKSKKDKEKKERSIDMSGKSDIQFLKDSEEFADLKRSMADEEIISMFLDKIKSNDSEVADDEMKLVGIQDADNAFEVLFGTQLHGRLAHKLQDVDLQVRPSEENSPENKNVDIVPLKSEEKPDSKVSSLKGEVEYDLEKESSTEQEEKQRQKRGESYFKSLVEKHSSKYLKDSNTKEFEDINDNKIIDEQQKKTKRSGLIIKLPRLDDKVTLKKMTGTLLHVGKSLKTKMKQMMPGFGLVVSFLLQMALAHARAAASMAGMLSNMAIGSAMIGMIRDTFFGSNKHPQVKYVYDNDKVEPGITWPAYGSGSHYHDRGQ